MIATRGTSIRSEFWPGTKWAMASSSQTVFMFTEAVDLWPEIPVVSQL